jgi:hypothetical protein
LGSVVCDTTREGDAMSISMKRIKLHIMTLSL